MNNLKYLLIIISILIFSCGTTDVSDGSSSTMGNPYITGTIHVNGTPIPNAEIFFLDTGYIYSESEAPLPVLTDAAGEFSISNLKPGRYRITAISPDTIHGIIVDTIVHNDTNRIDLKLSAFSYIKTEEEQKLTIPGTPLLSETGLLKVPTGTVPLVVTLDTLHVITDTIVEELLIEETDTVKITPQLATVQLVDSAKLSERKNIVTIGSLKDSTLLFIEPERFSKLQNDKWSSKDFDSFNLRNMHIASDETVWIGSDSGIVQSSLSGYAIWNTEESPLKSNKIHAHSYLSDTLWIFSDSAVQTMVDTFWTTYSYSETMNSSITTAAAFSQQNIVVGTQSDGVWLGEIKSDTVHWEHMTLPEKFSFNSNSVTAIEIVENSQCWIADSTMAVLWDIEINEIITTFNSTSSIQSLHYDAEGKILWILEENSLSFRNSQGTYRINSASFPEVSSCTLLGAGRIKNEILVGYDKSILAVTVVD